MIYKIINKLLTTINIIFKPLIKLLTNI